MPGYRCGIHLQPQVISVAGPVAPQSLVQVTRLWTSMDEHGSRSGSGEEVPLALAVVVYSCDMGFCHARMDGTIDLEISIYDLSHPYLAQ